MDFKSDLQRRLQKCSLVIGSFPYFITVCSVRFNDDLLENPDIVMFTPFNISNADFLGIKIIKKCKINRRAYSYEVVS